MHWAESADLWDDTWLGHNDDGAYDDCDSDGNSDSDDDAAMMVTMMMDTLFGSANAQLYTVGNAHTVQNCLG